MENINFGFKHRYSKPNPPAKGYFYWIDDSSGPQIWFAPTENQTDMVLLNQNVEDLEGLRELVSKVENLEGSIDEIQTSLSEINTILGGIDLSQYLKQEDLDGYAKTEDIPTNVSELHNDAGYLTENDLADFVPPVDLGDSDWDTIEDMIAEKVNEKSVTLTWQVI